MLQDASCCAYRAICVDVHQRAALVVGHLGERDAKLGGSDSQAALAPAVLQPAAAAAAAAAAAGLQPVKNHSASQQQTLALPLCCMHLLLVAEPACTPYALSIFMLTTKLALYCRS
jgi:hypothetical protein